MKYKRNGQKYFGTLNSDPEYIYVVLADSGHQLKVHGAYRSRRKAFRESHMLEDEGIGGRAFKTELIDKKFERSAFPIRVPKIKRRNAKKKKRK